MRHTRRGAQCIAAVLATLLACICGPFDRAKADDYPARPITLIVLFPAGVGVDTVARVRAQKLSSALTQNGSCSTA